LVNIEIKRFLSDKSPTLKSIIQLKDKIYIGKMILHPMDKLTEKDVEYSLNYVMRDGFISNIMIVLTTGTFLISYALLLGANFFIIGLIAAIPPLTNLLQIPTVFLIEKIRNRRLICVISLSLYRTCLLIIGLIPFLSPPDLSINLFLIFLVLQSIFASIGHTAWAFWIHDIIPKDKLGTFFSKRILLSTIVGMITSMLAGIFLDYWKNNYPQIELYSYSILFTIAFFFGLLSVYIISRIFEPKMIKVENEIKFIRTISEPFKDKNYKNLLIFLLLWNFTTNLSIPFFTVYMLDKLKLNLIIIVSLNVLSQLANLLFLRLWGNLTDKFSNKSVLKLSCPLFLFCILLWVFTSMPNTYFLTIPLLIIIHIFIGISLAGTTVALTNISMKLSPKGRANWYLAITSVISSLALGIAPIIGGLFADYFELSELSWSFNWTSPTGNLTFQILNLQGFDFFFIIAFFIGIFSLHRLALIREEGYIKDKLFLNIFLIELSKKIKNIIHPGSPQEWLITPISIVKYHPRKHVKNLRRVEKYGQI